MEIIFKTDSRDHGRLQRLLFSQHAYPKNAVKAMAAMLASLQLPM